MSARRTVILALAALGCSSAALAQTPILTQHYDNARTGQNTAETILTPTNVTATTFGKLFTLSVDGYVYAQPLYVPGVAISGKGTHNVLYVATENDSLYAFDADTGGAALWQVSFLINGATTLTPSDVGNTQDINPIIGITGTPVINSATNTLYVLVNTKESGNIIYRLHALDITSGAEKFGGPVVLSASVPGTAPDAVGGQVPFNPQWENNRPGMLFLNGYVYIGFAAHGDNGPWHGWILAYNGTTLAQTGAWCTSPNGKGNGLWAAGSGLAVDANGYAYVATGNGDDTVTTPAPAPSTTIDYGDSLVKVNLANGVLTPTDYFTPYNQSSLDGADSDVGSGGALVLPDQTGTYPHILVESGKQGHLYVVNRDKMTSDGSHYCNGCSSDPEILQTVDIDGGLWSMPAYWNGNVYVWGSGGALQAYSVTSGAISASATSQSAATSGFPGSTPVISSNGTTNGIVWAAETDAYTSSGPAILRAYSATNVSNLLYASNLTSGRDTMGPAVKFAVPVVTNGKVYVGAQEEVDVFGLLSDQSPTVAPAFSPAGGSYVSAQSVTLSSTTAGATFYYTTNGTVPTTSSTLYSGAISVSATTTINAIAVAPGFSQSAVSTATFTIGSQAAPVQFSPAAGIYNSTQSVALSSTTAGATIYYSTTGTATTSSTVYSGPIMVASTATISAIATASGLTQSTATSAIYTIAPGTISYAGGFANSTGMQFNGTTDLDDSRLQLTDGGTNQAGSAFFTTPQNIQSFTNNFTFQLSDAQADGITFTIQNSPSGAMALGPSGGGLGYGPDNPTGTPGIPNSVAVKYDLYSNNGEGDDSTGLYTDGASPTTPAIDMTSSGVILNNGDTMSVQMTYNGTMLTMTITDAVVAKTFSTSWTVNIPQIVGSNTAYVGFTGGTGGETASQKIETWTFTPTTVTGTQVSTPIISPGSETFSGSVPVQITDATSGSTIYYTMNGSAPVVGASGTTQYAGAITVSATTTVNAIATAPGDTASAEATAVYTQQAAATPVITPGTETFTGTVSVTMSDSTAGSTIYYTTNGNAPVVGASGTTPYSAAFTASATTTVKAMTVASGFANSGVASATYTLQGSAATPVITPGTETFAGTVSVTMSDSTAGST
ncbi:MAG: chitobiase/beta-hexosaminidase C-terminal domain-containing protein, partial [Candidatus Acidiferrales bacterium]